MLSVNSKNQLWYAYSVSELPLQTKLLIESVFINDLDILPNDLAIG